MTSRWMAWCVTGAAVLVAVNRVGALQQSTPTSAGRTVLDQYCVSCHNDRSHAGGLSLSSVDPANVGANPRLWEAAVRKLRARAMPPAGARRPDEHTYDQLLSSLETGLDVWA